MPRAVNNNVFRCFGSWSFAYLIYLEKGDALFCNLASGETNQIIIQYFMISNFIIRVLTFIFGECSRKRFSEKQAENWWAENRARVYEQYNVRMIDKSSVGVGSEDLAH